MNAYPYPFFSIYFKYIYSSSSVDSALLRCLCIIVRALSYVVDARTLIKQA